MARILFLTSRFPYPLDKGDKLRVFNQVKGLAERHEVHLVSLSEVASSANDMNAVRPYCASMTDHVLPRWKRMMRLPLAFASGLPLQVQYFRSRRIAHSIAHQAQLLRPDVVHCHLIRMAPYVTAGMAPRLTLDYMDCFSVGAVREAVNASLLKRSLLRYEYRQLLRYERATGTQFDGHCIISPDDRSHLPLRDTAQVRLVANGVDRSIFHPLVREQRYDVLFTGHMGYPPNIAAALFTAREVMPRLRRMKPDAKLLIAGIGATAEIRALQSERTDVVERFTHIREAFAQSRVMVAPMFISIGLQNKILQAMAMEIPVVTTSQGNAAIGGEHEKHLFVADSAEAITSSIHALLTDRALRDRMTRDAASFLDARFTWERANDALEQLWMNTSSGS